MNADKSVVERKIVGRGELVASEGVFGRRDDRSGRGLTRKVTLAIPHFTLPAKGDAADDVRAPLLSAALVMLDASEVRPAARRLLQAIFASVEARVYVVIDSDGPFVAGEVPPLIREVRSGAAFVVRGAVWRARCLMRSHPIRNRLALRVADRVLRDSRRDVFSGLFVIQRSEQAAKSGF